MEPGGHGCLKRQCSPGRSGLRPILLVEDRDNDLELELEALRAHQLANPIEVARDGEEALDYLYRRGRYASRHGEDPLGCGRLRRKSRI